MVSGFAIAVFGICMPTKLLWLQTLAFATVVVFFLETMRFLIPAYNMWATRTMHALIREGEDKHLSGIFYYCLGCFLAVLLFPKSVAILAILFLALGDPIAAMVGIVFGKSRPFPNPDFHSKSVEGSLACFCVCSLVTWAVTSFLHTPVFHSWSDRLVFALLGGFCAMIGEILPLRTDDNLAMPLISGALLWLLASMLNLMPGLYLV